MADTSTSHQGLTSLEAKNRLAQYGYNEFIEKNEYTALKIFFSQFKSFLIIILIIAGTISLALNETIDAIAIFVIVIINAWIGFIQEYKAENAVRALKKMVVQHAIVIRDGERKEIPIRELVPGDMVIVSEGDKVPADMVLCESYSIQVDEAVLTGESTPAEKSAAKHAKDPSPAPQHMLYKGTIVATGRGQALILTTGMKTEFGKIVGLVSTQRKTRSPLTEQLDNLSKKLGLLILVIIALLFLIGIFREINLFHMFMTSVALGVSAIPEGMPIIVTLTLAIGVQLLAGKKAIVRKMNAIETLGATTIICSDKTGTLTLNEMTVKKIFVNNKEHEIPGLGYTWENHITLNSPEEKKLLEIANNCNNASLGTQVLGDPTEIALKVLAAKAGHTKIYKELDEHVFTSERKMMSTLHKIGAKKEVFAKGAFEEIIARSTHILRDGTSKKLTPDEKKALSKIAEKYSKEALRVLALAYKPLTHGFTEKNLIFVGIVAMLDPPRDTVEASLKTAQRAGIQVKIITGDNPITAKAVGESIGLTVTQVLTGQDIDHLNDQQLKKALATTQIFARTSPQHKYRLVDLLKRHHEVVAVTGDGVNDAPALKHADVGIAMGIKGTEATKEVADIILKDDNFTTIVRAIEEGRRIYDNILAFIKYMLAANFDILITVGFLTLIGMPLPLVPLQVLWINIATDSLPALALGASEAEPGIMNKPPHPKKERMLRKFAVFIGTAVALQIFVNLILYFYGYSLDQAAGINTADLNSASHARTLVFTQIVVFELLLAFVCTHEKSITLRSLTENKKLLGAVAISFILQLLVIYTPPLQRIFDTLPLAPKEWMIIVAFGMTAFLLPPITQSINRIRQRT